MKDAEKYIFPKDMRCPSCNALLILDEDEMMAGKLSCPECSTLLDHTEITNPVGQNRIYCPECHVDYPKQKKVCPECGEDNPFIERAEPESVHAPFLFRTMISGDLISVGYILGVILITLISIAMLLASQLIMSFALLIVGNVIWRVICESCILFFSTHKLLNRILGELEYMNARNDEAKE